jgi:hypothetical protein
LWTTIRRFHYAQKRLSPRALEKQRLELTAFLESAPIKHAVIHFGVEDHLLAFPALAKRQPLGY